ncbi:MAG: STAS-like domain-containing protein [Hormoscilla sp. GUM202]|nr:STAS-like domain-containing protein [Hormoscilla sp. GUM202]
MKFVLASRNAVTITEMNILTTPTPTTSETVTIAVTEIMGHNLCIANVDGQKVCEAIAGALRSGKRVIVSFKDGEDITSAFLADAIGHLYALFPEDFLEANLRAIDMEPDDAADLLDTIEDVKEYLQDPKAWEAAARATFGDDYYE